MMDNERQLKLQAYLDGELPEGERRAVEAWLAQDAEAVGLLAELRHTNAALGEFEASLTLPESREFYWSKIQREIQRQQVQPRLAATEFRATGWRRLFLPASALAGLAMLVLVTLQLNVHGPAAGLEAAIEDGSVFTYRDQSQGMTLVWLSYNADDDSADIEYDETQID
jgi:anti-sigma factor RsiW